MSSYRNPFRKNKGNVDDDVVLPELTRAADPGGAGGYDIGAIAEQAGTTPIPFVDDRLIAQDGTLKDLDPATTQVRENTVRLGDAAADAVLDRTTREAGTHHASGEEI